MRSVSSIPLGSPGARVNRQGAFVQERGGARRGGASSRPRKRFGACPPVVSRASQLVASLSLVGCVAACAPLPPPSSARRVARSSTSPAVSPSASTATAAGAEEPRIGAGGCRGAGAPIAMSRPPPSDWQRLDRGERVEVPVRFDRCGKRYVGGVSYIVVKAPPRAVFASLNELGNLAKVIRGTRKMTVTGVTASGVRVLLEQGNRVVSASYSAIFLRTPPQGQALDEGWEVRFWLDPSRPHAIEDVWGFFRASPWQPGGTLVTVGAALDLGPGLIRMLFEDHLQKSILRMPRYVRAAVEH